MANLFVQLLVNPDQNYLHPVTRRKTVVSKAFNEVSLKSREAFTSFFSHFSREYTPTQREHLTAVVDRLVQDVTRRKQGEFFTPTIWVDKGHEYISSVCGENWKEKYTVWDPAWGTGNLTRDYKFKELYVSTLNYSDIQTAEQMGYNTEAIKFQGDFLNDQYEYLPQSLKTSIESGKDILLLFNPPYGTANENSTEEGSNKAGIANTEVRKELEVDNMGKSREQLYAQFLYRIIKLNKKKNITLAMYTPPLYLTGESFLELRKLLLENFEFKKGFIMDAANFADVKSWGLTFSILTPKK
jgi:hypothetical protein